MPLLEKVKLNEYGSFFSEILWDEGRLYTHSTESGKFNRIII